MILQKANSKIRDSGYNKKSLSPISYFLFSLLHQPCPVFTTTRFYVYTLRVTWLGFHYAKILGLYDKGHLARYIEKHKSHMLTCSQNFHHKIFPTHIKGIPASQPRSQHGNKKAYHYRLILTINQRFN